MSFLYNLHDIIRLKSDVELELGFFRCETLEGAKPDLIIQTVDYQAVDRKGCQRIGAGLYYSEKKNSIMSSMNIMGLKVSWEICNPLGPTTLLNVSKSYMFLSKYVLISPISSVHRLKPLVRMVLQLKLLLNNHTFMVGGGTIFRDRNIVFSGTGTSGKTITTIGFTERSGSDFLSDDLLVANKDAFFSFPVPLKLRKFNLDFISYCNWEQPNEKFKNRIGNCSEKESDIYFLELSHATYIQELTVQTGIAKLCALNNRALIYFNERILSVLPYMYMDLDLASLQSRMKNILSQRLRNARFFTISALKTIDYIPLLADRYGID